MEQVIVKNQSEEYMVNVIRSKRKTMALQVGLDGTVVARVPNRVAKKEVLRFLDSHAAWIAAAKKKMARRQQEKQAYRSPYEIPAYDSLSKREKDEIQAHFMQRLMYYAPKIGVTFERVAIRNQKGRWGSCSSKGNLNFNCLLMLTPPEVLDSVVVHELCHRKEMNHSEKFYSEVLRVFPDYWKWDKWLKENGNLLMMRMTK